MNCNGEGIKISYQYRDIKPCFQSDLHCLAKQTYISFDFLKLKLKKSRKGQFMMSIVEIMVIQPHFSTVFHRPIDIVFEQVALHQIHRLQDQLSFLGYDHHTISIIFDLFFIFEVFLSISDYFLNCTDLDSFLVLFVDRFPTQEAFIHWQIYKFCFRIWQVRMFRHYVALLQVFYHLLLLRIFLVSQFRDIQKLMSWFTLAFFFYFDRFWKEMADYCYVAFDSSLLRVCLLSPHIFCRTVVEYILFIILKNK